MMISIFSIFCYDYNFICNAAIVGTLVLAELTILLLMRVMIMLTLKANKRMMMNKTNNHSSSNDNLLA